MTGTERRSSVGALRQELRRGTLVLAVLAVLRAEFNGSAVRGQLAAGGVTIEEGALYPMLRRLEEQGLLTSEWRLEGSRNKRFYKLSHAGAATLDELVAEGRQQTTGLTYLIQENDRDSG